MIDPSVLQEIEHYQPKNKTEKENAIKEILQEIILAGLCDTDFFDYAAFYGGTALRIFYGLDRFSEDLDFSLTEQDSAFSLSRYFDAIERKVNSYGFDFSVQDKEKKHPTAVQSAYLRGNEREHLLLLFPRDEPQVSGNQQIKIKFEVDTAPDSGARFEQKLLTFPYMAPLRLFDKPSLFAGKAAAVVSRNWGQRIKGRDLYDYLFYLQSHTGINLDYFWSQLKGHPDFPDSGTLDDCKALLNQKFETLDYETAKKDVAGFISNSRVLQFWSAEYFQTATNQLLQQYDYSTDKNTSA